jgi:hypothetical protein
MIHADRNLGLNGINKYGFHTSFTNIIHQNTLNIENHVFISCFSVRSFITVEPVPKNVDNISISCFSQNEPFSNFKTYLYLDTKIIL